MKSPLTSLRPAALLPESTRQLLRAVGRRFHDGRCAQVAASLAFTTLLSLVPFVTLVAECLARLRGIRPESLGDLTTQNLEALCGWAPSY